MGLEMFPASLVLFVERVNATSNITAATNFGWR